MPTKHNAWLYQEDKSESSLLREGFWARLRATLFNKISKGPGGPDQWAFITGKKRRDSEGNKLYLMEKNFKILERTVEHLNTEGGRDQLMEIQESNIPDSVDDLIDIIQATRTKEEVKRDEFRLFLKHRERIMRYLLKYY